MKLTICPCCQRHVNVEDGACPFCATKRATHGVLVALAVGAGALVACSGSTDTGSGGSPGASGSGGSTDKDAVADTAEDQQAGYGGTGGMAYGPPPDAMSEMSTAYGPPPDAMDEGTAGAYGPPPDASDEAMSGAYGPPPDASGEASPGMGGAYGPPPQ